MQRESVKGTFGDSARNRTENDLKPSASNHVFDGAGEHAQYYSDSESLTSKKTRTRYINPAIYIEPVEVTHSVTSLHTDSSCVDDITPHPHSSYKSSSTPMLSVRSSSVSSGSVKRKSCRLGGGGAEDAYGSEEEETPRNSRTYRDGADTFRLSVASVSTTTTAKEERENNERRKRDAFEQWLARKEQEKRERARSERVKRPVAPIPTAEQRESTYQRWLERKRVEDERRRAEELVRQYRNHERIERERRQRQRDREEKLSEWARRKEDEVKDMKTRKERRAARAALDESKRRSMGERAYQDWLRTSKSKPLPVPLNQGVLSMRGSVSSMYINPIPWQAPT